MYMIVEDRSSSKQNQKKKMMMMINVDRQTEGMRRG